MIVKLFVGRYVAREVSKTGWTLPQIGEILPFKMEVDEEIKEFEMTKVISQGEIYYDIHLKGMT